MSFFSVPYEVSIATTNWGTGSELAEVLDLGAGKVEGRAVAVP